MVRRQEGSITVFLALAGLLVFALFCVMVETARFGACENHAARTLRTATEGLLTEYSRPLYDHYGLFLMEQEGTPYETVIARYAGDMMEAAGKGTMNFFRGAFRNIQITEKVTAGDDGAEPLAKEITAYMERRLPRNLLTEFTDTTKNLQETERQAEEIEDTVEEQRENAALDGLLLELMRLVDGISVSGGKVRCEACFVKSFSTKKKPEGEKFGVTEAGVFRKMKPRIDTTPAQWEKMNVRTFLSHVKKAEEITKKAVQKGEELRSRYKAGRHQQGKRTEDSSGVVRIIESLPVLQGNLRVLEETEKLLAGGGGGAIPAGEVPEETLDRLDVLWKDYDTGSISFDYTGISGDGGGENPLDALSGAWGNGILNLVCKNPQSLSKKSVKDPDHYGKYYGMTAAESGDYGERVDRFAREEEVELSGVLGGTATGAWDTFCLCSYITDTFSSLLQKAGKGSWKHKLDYQWEYVMAGKKSDKANLESVLNRILLIRTVINFSALFQDAGRKGEAYAAAAAVVGFTGMEPLIRLTQTLILIAWSMVESLVDIAGLLQGRDVPVVKTPKQILTSFAELFLITGNAITKRAEKFAKGGKNSFGYKEYLKLFLLAMNKKTMRYRVMDVIEWDMGKNGYTGFSLGSCVYSLTVEGSAVFPSHLLPQAPVRRFLGKDLRQYQPVCRVKVSYI